MNPDYTSGGTAEHDSPPQFPVPDGWVAFGALVDYDGPTECSDEVGRDGLPLWERPIPNHAFHRGS